MNNTTNPYSTSFNTTAPKHSMDPGGQLKNHKQEEERYRSEKILPYSVETLNKSVGDLYIKLMEIKSAIFAAENDPNVTLEDANTILNVIEQISEKITIDLPIAIDKLYL